jgi:branched-chain amino acid transport system permease protein
MTVPAFRIRTATTSSRVFSVLGLLAVLGLVLVPTFAERNVLVSLTRVLILLALAQLWNLLAGYAGIYSFGQQAFVGIGAYAAFALADIVGWSLWPSIAAGAVFAALISLPTGFLVFRLRGGYFAIGTWVIAETYRLIVKNNATLFPRGTPQPLRALADLGRSRFSITYWLALAVAVATVLGVYMLMRSKVGLALGAVRDDIEAAGSSGVNVYRIQLLVYVLVAAMTGIVGAVYLLNTVSIDPDSYFSIGLTADMVLVVVIGGLGTIEGPILGTVVFFFLEDNFADLGTWWFMLLGALLVVIIIRAPRGLWGLFREKTGIRLFPIQRELVLEGDQK